jgi:decaprenylphospho-beta-D-ribofuranose 2-oxidase
MTFPDFDRLTLLRGSGRAAASAGYLYRPSHVEQVAKLLEQAARYGWTVAPRGAGRSYGDAALNGGQVVLDLQRLNRVLDWNPATGVIRAEPGVTIEQLWQTGLEDGWWPPVVPGTSRPTLGGCLAMNIHGKNNYRAGTIGEHVLAFEALLPSGQQVHCTPQSDPELFYSLISSAGLLGIFTSITLQMHAVQSGDLVVTPVSAPNLPAMLDTMEPIKSEADYLVGWVDTTVGGRGLGRGQIHRAQYVAADDEPNAARSLGRDHQKLPETILGVIPRAAIWPFMPLGFNPIMMPWVNTGKYLAGRRENHHAYRQSLVEFSFLLDSLPIVESAYGKRGLIQYQSFVPRGAAADAFQAILALTQRRGLPSYLGVLKRHRPDRFLFTHAVDGFSLALDFPVPRHVEALAQMAQELDRVVLEAGGRFYFAKDSTLTPYAAARYLGPATLARFQAIKTRCDPQGVLQTELYRRALAPAVALAAAGEPLTLPESLLQPAALGAAAPASGNGNGQHG